MWRSHAACRPGLQFTDCQPGQKMRAGGRPRPGGAAGEGCEKQTPGGGPQAPRPATDWGEGTEGHRAKRDGGPPGWGTGAPARGPRMNGVGAAGSCDRGVISFMRRSLHCGAGAAAHGRSPSMEGPKARSFT